MTAVEVALVPAREVRVGDTIRLGGDVTVITVRRHGVPGHVYVGVRTAGGAEIVHELRDSEPVRVLGAAS